jgi:integrase
MGLRRGHIDLNAATLLVERAKLRKTRIVPLHPTVTCAMRRYLLVRDKRWGVQPERGMFLGSRGQALSVESAQDRFRQVCEGLGWQCGNGEIARPRLHDLRHTFACRRLQGWYEQGCNVHQHINALAIYLGHDSVSSTYWYLTATPALLDVAGSRFERFASQSDGRSP